MSELVFIVLLVCFLASSCLYSVYYARSESIVCIRIHLSKHPMKDYYHLCRLLDKAGLFLIGSTFTLNVLWLFKYGNISFGLFFAAWTYITAICSYHYFDKNFNGTGEKLLEIDGTWKFSTGWKWLDSILGFKW